MKNLFNRTLSGLSVGVGFCAGWWLWTNVLEEKADNLKERLVAKKGS